MSRLMQQAGARPPQTSEETLLNFAVSHAPAVFYIADLERNRPLTFISSNVGDILGHSHASFVNDPHLGRELFHPDDRAMYRNRIDNLSILGRDTLEYRFLHGDGDYRWIRDDVRYVDDGGKVEFVGCMVDITAQKETEERLEAVEALTSTIINATLDALITIEVDGSILEFNPAAQKLFGYSREEAVGQSLDKLIVPRALREKHLQGMKAFRTKETLKQAEMRMETRGMNKDGDEFPVELTISYARLGDRSVLIGAIRDISDRVAAEAEQKRLTQLIQDAIESLPHGFSITDSEPKIALCNTAYAEALDLKPDDMVGMSSREGIRRFLEVGKSYDNKLFSDDPGIEDELSKRFEKANHSPLEMEVELKDGTWWLLTCNRITDGGYVTVRTDITRQKQAEAAMRESRERIHKILEACPLPVNVTQLSDGKVLYESPASKKLFAREGLPEPAQSIDIYANPKDREEYVRQLRKYGVVDGLEFRLRRMNGEEFWGSVSAKRIEINGIDCIVSSTWDMTGDLALEEELSRQREALHQSEKLGALGEMLAGVAHELNNPLSVLVGQALLLQETATDDKIVTRAEKIGNAADRCARIVKTFLAMARQQPLNRRSTEVNAMVESALEITAFGVRAAGISVSTRMGNNLPTVWVDPDQINQVLTNLIVNAQHVLEKHDGEKRIHISSSYRKKGNEVVIKIRDTGPGIPPEIRSRVFEPFFTTKEVGAGTGIGLAFCHRIMEFHGGRIKLDSAPGEGAAFVVRIPVGTPGMPEMLEVENIARDTQRLKVLVIDDEEDVTEILYEILSRDGHQVHVAANGNRALNMIANDDFDIILSDLRMPELDGPSLYRILEEKYPHLNERIGFITGDAMSPKVAGFLATCGRPHLEKPITPEEVRDIVSKVTDPKLASDFGI